MSRIFISYAYADGADVARELVAELEAAGLTCWMGQRDLRVGEDFPPQIVAAIRECRALAVLITPGANASRDILQEVHLAHNARKPMVPIVVQGTSPSDGLAYYVGIVQQIAWGDARGAASIVRTLLTRTDTTDQGRQAEQGHQDDPATRDAQARLDARRTGAEVQSRSAPQVAAAPARGRSTAEIQGLDLLPKHLAVLLGNPDPDVRLHAVTELARLMADRSPSLSAAARQALGWLKDDPDARVSKGAVSALSGLQRRPGDVFRDGAGCPEMVVIPPGRFLMGSPEEEPGRSEHEGPVHEVTMDYSLAVAKYPVTRGEWRRYLAETRRQGSSNAWGLNMKTGDWERMQEYGWSNPGYPQEDSHPVVCVTWQEAADYARWLTAKTGQRYRLLSEAEHEYVNRAGTRTACWWGDSSKDQWRYANGADAALKAKHDFSKWIYLPGNDGFAHTSPVGHFPANPFGLHDTSGNVWCWTLDSWHENYEGAPTDGSAWESEDDGRRVVRGGSWNINPQGLRSANRGRCVADYSYNNQGFRVARTAS